MEYRARFDRQIRFRGLGEAGQERLQRARVALVGCGALGGVLAQSLVRAGVGYLRLIDRDIVEESNLARQVLFEEQHARAALPKVEAALESLRRIGGPTAIEVHNAHLDASNLPELLREVDLLLDGTDNLATRYLMNDWCVEHKQPWIYGGVVGGGGLVMAILPQSGPCLRCIFPEPPPPGSLATCDTAGVILPAVGAIASLQAGLALRVLAGVDALKPRLIELDAWTGDARSLEVAQDPACPCCVHGERSYLSAVHVEAAQVLCGRNAVQVRGRGAPANFESLAHTLAALSPTMEYKGHLLRFSADGLRMTLFRDGRALIEGTEEVERALSFYDHFVGT